MPRKPRADVEDAIHHVYARGNDRQCIYRDDVDRTTYLRMLGRVVIRQNWRCLAYCLMNNHVHLLLETLEANLGAGMQRLQGLYAQTFNERHGRCGHVFQGRYGSVLITSDEQLLTVASYIAHNPVESGLCKRPEQWPWSSHAAVLGRPSPHWLDVERLLWYFDATGGDPRRCYAEFIGRGQTP